MKSNISIFGMVILGFLTFANVAKAEGTLRILTSVRTFQHKAFLGQLPNMVPFVVRVVAPSGYSITKTTDLYGLVLFISDFEQGTYRFEVSILGSEHVTKVYYESIYIRDPTHVVHITFNGGVIPPPGPER